jgi:hypothetical protein
MSRSGFRLLVALAFAFTLAFAAAQSSYAQHTNGDDGTGGAAGYSLPPPADTPDASRSMKAPTPPADDSASQPQPDAEPTPAPDDNKTPDGDQSPDAPTGADQPD